MKSRHRAGWQWPQLLINPVVLLALAVGVHVIGRSAALRTGFMVDSLAYSVAAHQFWQPGVTVEALVRDKPPGQALLTGWVYRLTSGPPTRLDLVPIESVFMIGGYAVFLVLAGGLFGTWVGAALTLFLVIAQNTFNALDATTDGFNLNENYLLLPMASAALAHLYIRQPNIRGLSRGFAVGIALTIKQTTAGMLAAILLHDLVCTLAAGNCRLTGGTSADARAPEPFSRRIGSVVGGVLFTFVGIFMAWAPFAAVLAWRGWLGQHVNDLLTHSGKHVAINSWAVAQDGRSVVRPVLPVLWWMALGAIAAGTSWRNRSGRTASEGLEGRRRGAAAFILIWLIFELAILLAMIKPATHYLQQTVVPAILAAGLGIEAMRAGLRSMEPVERDRAWRWVIVVTAGLTVLATMPLIGAARSRSQPLDPALEAEAFAQAMERWPPESVSAPSRRRQP